jgi:hypothetical protein
VRANPSGVALADLDRDGDLDLAVLKQTADEVAVVKNGGKGEFTIAGSFRTGTKPTALAAADLNGDGVPDLAAANAASGDVSVFLNQGDGAFAGALTLPAGADPSSIAAALLNRDPRPDLVVANSAAFGGTPSLSIYFNQGNATFLSQKVDLPPGSGPAAVTAFALDHEGGHDLAVANQLTHEVAVYRTLHEDATGLATYARLVACTGARTTPRPGRWARVAAPSSAIRSQGPQRARTRRGR